MAGSRKRKRVLVDRKTQLSNEYMKEQLKDTADIVEEVCTRVAVLKCCGESKEMVCVRARSL